MLYNSSKGQEGFTLIEVILTVAITSLVFTVLLSFFSPRLSLYLRASDEANLHSELNIINRKIHDELINSTEVQLLGSEPSSYQSGYKYFYINGNNRLIKVEPSGNTKIVNSNIDFKKFDLSLNKRSGDKQNFVTIELEGKLENADHQIVFNVLLNNIKEKSGSDSVVGIKYK